MKNENCKPCVFSLFNGSVSKPPIFSLPNIESAAFEAVMDVYSDYLSQYRYSASHKRYIDEMLSQGAASLKIKTRFRPIVTARYLMYNYLIGLGYSAQKIAPLYNVDRTTVMHGNSQIQSMLKSRFDNDLKDAYIEFTRLTA